MTGFRIAGFAAIMGFVMGGFLASVAEGPVGDGVAAGPVGDGAGGDAGAGVVAAGVVAAGAGAAVWATAETAPKVRSRQPAISFFMTFSSYPLVLIDPPSPLMGGSPQVDQGLPP